MTNECMYCGKAFTEANPCWNSYATYSAEDDETKILGHDGGICMRCEAKRGDPAARRAAMERSKARKASR
jgi:hypothetical protein